MFFLPESSLRILKWNFLLLVLEKLSCNISMGWKDGKVIFSFQNLLYIRQWGDCHLVQKQGFVVWKRFPYVVSPGMIHCTQFSESGFNALPPAGCLQFPYRILLIILIETFLDEWLQKCILSLPCIFKPSDILFTCFYLLNWSRNTNFGILHLPACIFITVYFYLNSSILHSNW